MKRKNLITLLAFFPLFSVWGQSSLNPVEKEKLKLPELPQTMLRATAQAKTITAELSLAITSGFVAGS